MNTRWIPLLLALNGCAMTVSPTPEAPDGAVDLCPALTGRLAVASITDRGVIPPIPFMLPLRPDEEAFNARNAPAQTLGVWETSSAPDPAGGAWVFYTRLIVRPGYLNFEGLSAGVGRRSAGGAFTRVNDDLFTAREDAFTAAATLHDGYVHAFGCRVVGVLDAECRVGRAPADRVSERRAWTFWDGAGWSPDIARAAVVARGMNGPTMDWNPHVGAYVAAYGAVLGNDLFLRTAPRPEGPWSAPVRVFTGLPAGDGRSDYNFALRPELSSDDGCTLAITYDHPTSPTQVETRRVDLHLAP